MEGLGAEVTQKIKSAIQAKLMELGAYVDDELPDYVMVMVGNKRSKAQMEHDLQLFLGNNTIPFTSWLYQVLQKLQEVTVANKNKNVKPIKKERSPSFEDDDDDDFINIAETDGDLLEDEIQTKRKSVEKTVKPKNEKPSEKVLEYLPSKIKDKKTSEDSISEKKVEKISRETNTVVKKKITYVDISVKKSSVCDTIRSSREETNSKKDDIRKRPRSRSPVKERSGDKVYDARELLNRKKAEKLATKDVSKVSDEVKRKREHSPYDRHSSKRTVSRVNELDALNRRVTVLKDNEHERNGREKDSSLKSTVHRTALKRKTSDDDKTDERLDRYKDDKNSENSRSNKVIRISETLQAEQALVKPRSSSKTVISVSERKSLHSRIAAPKENNRDVERDRDRESGVSSVVRITPRPKRPASQQPSSSLILKAVAEANKSLAAAPARPLQSSNRHLERPLRGKISPDKITITLPNHRVQPVSKDETSSYSTYLNSDNMKARLKDDAADDNNDDDDEDDDDERDKEASEASITEKDGGHFSANASCSTVHSHVIAGSEKGKEVDEAINQWLKGVEDADPKKPVLESFSSQETDLDSEPVLEICQNMSELEPEEEPEFVVTLHGLDPDMFPKVSENDESDESDREKLCSENEEIEDNGLISAGEDCNKDKSSPSGSPKRTSVSTKKRNSSPNIIVKQNEQQGNNEVSDSVKLKSLERCKYWPSCLLGEKCSYHHPSAVCKTFPACKYGEKCLFIHPPCKFGVACTRRDCPYIHGSPVVTGIPKVKINPLAGAVQNCRFYPNCNNLNCQFYHPKTCRFGRYCTKKDCLFEHKKGPAKDKLKWTRVQNMI